MKIDHAVVSERKQTLDRITKTLKQEFFGLDSIIDKVIESVYAWYVFPELIHRPVIINLWGMTGVGKTQIVRRLSSLLEFSNKFVEVQMDGTSGGYYRNNLCSIISSCIEEGERGIILLDEIQRFRTIDDHGADVKVERYQDVWALLSDGKFASDSDMFSEIEMLLAHSEWNASKEAVDDKKKAQNERFKIYPYEAKRIKKSLKLTESIQEIMCWDTTKLLGAIDKLKSNKGGFEIDYTKCLIFVSGNLDSAFSGSMSTGDCDTDADFYHNVTKKINSTDIKIALGRRFKPEQIARFGSTHIIYPSMSRATYEKLIYSTCQRYVSEMTDLTDISFTLQDNVYEVIYNNSVYPTQGTRPVFSAIHNIFAHSLVNITSWALEEHITSVNLELNEKEKQLIGYDVNSSQKFVSNVDLEISNRKQQTGKEFLTMVAVHEAGHAMVYSLLYGTPPSETKINASSYSNGYIMVDITFQQDFMYTKKTMLDRIAISLAGTLAEELVFGTDYCSVGNASDLKNATKYASNCIRWFGFDNRLSYIESGDNTSVNWNTDLTGTNENIENILIQQKTRVTKLLTDNKDFFIKIVNSLLDNQTLDKQQFIDLAAEYIKLEPEIASIDYIDRFAAYSKSV